MRQLFLIAVILLNIAITTSVLYYFSSDKLHAEELKKKIQVDSLGYVDNVDYYQLFQNRIQQKQPNNHTLAVCITVVYEQKFLEEWLIYHALLGFDHYIIYDTEDSYETHKQLIPYIDAGLVTLYSLNLLEDPNWQRKLNIHCSENYAPISDWIGVFDVDEFVAFSRPIMYDPDLMRATSPKTSTPFLYFLNKMIAGKKSNGVILSRVPFNTVFDKFPEESLVIQELSTRPFAPHSNSFAKAILHTEYSDKVGTNGPHVLHLSGASASDRVRLRIHDATGRLIEWDGREEGKSYPGKITPVLEPVVMNHYILRDVEECLVKYEQQAKCCPNSWRVHSGPKFCYDHKTNFSASMSAWVVGDNSLSNSPASLFDAIQRIRKEFRARATTEPVEGVHFKNLDL